MAKESRCIVQFLHPGEEHAPDRPGVKEWNRSSDHKRKFLISDGRYLTDHGTRRTEVIFWGEWEPESDVAGTFQPPVIEGPRYLYSPFYQPPADGTWRQNTDPFVFGERFCYTGCQQASKPQLKRLGPGSLVLFGSCRNSRFILDTVLVVTAEHIDHNRSNYHRKLSGRISDTYKIVTIDPWYSGEGAPAIEGCRPGDDSVRLYFGASAGHPQDGMFSFFPCLPADAGTHGFARPAINLRDFVVPTQRQGVKIANNTDLETTRSLWHEVIRQVREQGLEIGVFADMPPCRSARTADTYVVS